MIDLIKNKIDNIENVVEGYIYLLHKFNDNSGIFLLNNKILFLEKNNNNEETDSIKTEYLNMNTNVIIENISEQTSFSPGSYNLVLFNKTNEIKELSTFLNLCESYSMDFTEITFKNFFFNIYNLFKEFRKDKELSTIGFYGELSVILFMYQSYGIDITNFWQTEGLTSKYDFVINDIPVDVKTTTSEKSFIIKHNQLFVDKKVFVILVNLIHDNSGETLDELIKKINDIDIFSNNFNFQLKIAKQKLKSYNDLDKRFGVSKRRLYNNQKLDKIDKIPRNISELTYKYDFTLQEESYFKELIREIYK